MTKFSYQLYSSRNYPPLETTLAMLAKAGYAQVEGFGGAYAEAGSAKALRAMLDKHGLAMPTAHYAIGEIENEASRVIADATTLGVDCIVVPWLAPEDRPTNSAGWIALGKRLEKAAQPLLKAGFKVAWHNHDFELFVTPQGDVPLNLLMHNAPSLLLELDVAWLKVAGESPAKWVNAFSKRIICIHLKDRAKKGENANQDGWADVGHGVMPWVSTIKAIKASSAQYLIVEHDNPSDHARFAKNAIASAQKFWS
jgi:sugar phosphate isomerase/epimerase